MKPWYKSKSIWQEGLTLTFAFVALNSDSFGDYADWALLVSGIAGVWLRLITSQAIKPIVKTK